MQKCPLDDDDPFINSTCDEKSKRDLIRGKPSIKIQPINEESVIRELGNMKSPRWTSGAGARIGCVRDYPTKLQFRALEHVNLSPRQVTTVNSVTYSSNRPIPSPRPSPRVHLSPRLVNMGRNNEHKS